MVNEAFAGLVIACNDTTIELYQEQIRYKVARNKRLAKKKKGDWIWFKAEDKTNRLLVTEASDMPRRWKSRLSDDGHILLDVNAVQRNYREYPEIKTAWRPLPNKPWACEIDYVEDPEEKLSYKRGYRVGKMHEVTVKMVVEEEQPGDNGVKFVIEEVFYESPTDIQLEMGYSPWIQQLLNTKRPVEDSIAPVRCREFDKVHPNNKDYGIVLRHRDGVRNVWSSDSGLLNISQNFATQYDQLAVGDFVFFKRVVRRYPKDIVAKDLEKTTRSVALTKKVERRRACFESLVETRIRFPLASEIPQGTHFFEHHDIFLGQIWVSIHPLLKMLKAKGVSRDEVYGKKVRVWAGPMVDMKMVDAKKRNALFWVIEEVFPHPLEIDDDEIDGMLGEDSEDSEENETDEENEHK